MDTSDISQVGYIARVYKYTHIVSWESLKHKQSFWEIVLCVEGHATHFVNDVKYDFKPSTIIIMKPDSVHNYRILDNQPYLHYDLYSSRNDMQKKCACFNSYLYEDISSNKTPIVLSLDNTTFAYFKKRIATLNSLESSPVNSELCTTIHDSLLYLLISLIIENSIIEHSSAPNWLNAFLVDINNPSVICGDFENVIKLSHYSHGHLCKLFKQHTGEKLIDYFIKLKMDYATHLLDNKEYSVLDIAGMVGYDSLSHFIKTFKKYNGVTPKQYRLNPKIPSRDG